jgi:hypothetical protein
MNRRLDTTAAWNAAVEAHLRSQRGLTARRRATLRRRLRGLRQRLLEARRQATTAEPQIRALVTAAATWARQPASPAGAPRPALAGRPQLAPARVLKPVR